MPISPTLYATIKLVTTFTSLSFTTSCKPETPELDLNKVPRTAVTPERNPTPLKSRAAPTEGREQCRFKKADVVTI